VQADIAAHITEITPPPDEQCRAPRAHRTGRPWDRCAMCAGQPALPGL
jgi:hypothetical protein